MACSERPAARDAYGHRRIENAYIATASERSASWGTAGRWTCCGAPAPGVSCKQWMVVLCVFWGGKHMKAGQWWGAGVLLVCSSGVVLGHHSYGMFDRENERTVGGV